MLCIFPANAFLLPLLLKIRVVGSAMHADWLRVRSLAAERQHAEALTPRRCVGTATACWFSSRFRQPLLQNSSAWGPGGRREANRCCAFSPAMAVVGSRHAADLPPCMRHPPARLLSPRCDVSGGAANTQPPSTQPATMHARHPAALRLCWRCGGAGVLPPTTHLRLCCAHIKAVGHKVPVRPQKRWAQCSPAGGARGSSIGARMGWRLYRGAAAVAAGWWVG